MEINDIWKKALEYIQADITSMVVFNTFISPARPVSFNGNVFTLAVTMTIGKTMIENHHKALIEDSLLRVTGQKVSLEVIIAAEEDIAKITEALPVETVAAEPTEPPKQNSEATYINPKYTFEKFVVGNSNRYAYNVAEAVAESPGWEYNPLFLYGNSGLGKTHLMLAIGNHIMVNHPEMKVTYVSSENFTNDMINALRDKKMDDFRKKYRQTDVLLIDDIQFIEGKESIQEEFFHTFNDLYSSNRQIVITSDRTPTTLTNLEERLRTRFSWGITTDIGIPDYETRMAILKKKAGNENVVIKDEIFDYIADKVNTNVRELEGALAKIIALSKMSKHDIDLKFAEDSLKKVLPEDKIIKITHKDIKEKVCTYFNVSIDELIGKSRTKDVATARQVAMYLCKKLTDMNQVRIGLEFGGKDRTTVKHNVDKIIKEIETDEEIRNAVNCITKDLQTI